MTEHTPTPPAQPVSHEAWYKLATWALSALLALATALAWQVMDRLDAVRLEVAAQRRDLEHHERLLQRLETKLDAHQPVAEFIPLNTTQANP